MKEKISFETFMKLYSIHRLISLNLLLINFSLFVQAQNYMTMRNGILIRNKTNNLRIM